MSWIEGISALDRVECFVSHLDLFTHRRNGTWYPLNRKLGELQSLSGRFRSTKSPYMCVQ